MTKLPRSTARRSLCPIATALDVFGDKWTLLVIRDIGMLKRHRNKDMQQGAENIPSNILADRLKKLLEKELIRKVPYQNNPTRYEYFLTDAGNKVLPILMAMMKWGVESVSGTHLPRRFKDSI